MVNNIANLDHKIRSTEFNLDQLHIGKKFFVNMITELLSIEEETLNNGN